jgi:hypothetical protein
MQRRFQLADKLLHARMKPLVLAVQRFVLLMDCLVLGFQQLDARTHVVYVGGESLDCRADFEDWLGVFAHGSNR